MPYDAQEMLRLAAHLQSSIVGGLSNETLSRAAISRAYYACWLTARDSLWGIDGHPSGSQAKRLTKNTHEQVIQAVGLNQAEGDAKRKRQRDSLAQLKALRTAADYRHSDTHPAVDKLFQQYKVADWQKLAEQALVLASQILPELSRHPRFQ